MRACFISVAALACGLLAFGCGGGSGSKAVTEDRNEVDFGDIPLLDCTVMPAPPPATETVTLVNDGDEVIVVNAVLEGAYQRTPLPCGVQGESFTVTPTEFILDPGASQIVVISFEPPDLGLHEAQLRFLGTGGDGKIVHLKGVGR